MSSRADGIPQRYIHFKNIFQASPRLNRGARSEKKLKGTGFTAVGGWTTTCQSSIKVSPRLKENSSMSLLAEAPRFLKKTIPRKNKESLQNLVMFQNFDHRGVTNDVEITPLTEFNTKF